MIAEKNGLFDAIDQGAKFANTKILDKFDKNILWDNVTSDFKVYQNSSLIKRTTNYNEAVSYASKFDHTKVIGNDGKVSWNNYPIYKVYQYINFLKQFDNQNDAVNYAKSYDHTKVIDRNGNTVWNNYPSTTIATGSTGNNTGGGSNKTPVYAPTNYMQKIAIICAAAYNTNFNKDASALVNWEYSQYGYNYDVTDWAYVDSDSWYTGLHALIVYNKNTHECVIAFRGSEFVGWNKPLSYLSGLADYSNVFLGFTNGQVSDAKDYVKLATSEISKVDPYAKFILAGHSLGGYIAAYVASEIQDGNIKINNFIGAYTFNSPGISEFPHPIKALKAKSYKIKNFNITDDVVHTLGSQLGSSIDIGYEYGNTKEKHAIANFYNNKKFYGRSDFSPL